MGKPKPYYFAKCGRSVSGDQVHKFKKEDLHGPYYCKHAKVVVTNNTYSVGGVRSHRGNLYSTCDGCETVMPFESWDIDMMGGAITICSECWKQGRLLEIVFNVAVLRCEHKAGVSIDISDYKDWVEKRIAERDAKIKELFLSGVSVKDISDTVGTEECLVRYSLSRHGLREKDKTK